MHVDVPEDEFSGSISLSSSLERAYVFVHARTHAGKEERPI